MAAAEEAGSKVKIDCSGTKISASTCDELGDFFNAAVGDALNAKRNGLKLEGNPWSDLAVPNTKIGTILALTASRAATVSEATAYADALLAWEKARLDKQLGNTPSTGGSTGLVEKPGTTGLVALAVESGAFTSASSGSNVTLTGNPWNLIQMARQKSPFSEVITASNRHDFANEFSVIAALAVSQTGSQTLATNGSATSASAAQTPANILLPTSSGRLSSFTARYNFLNSLDPAGKKFQTAWLAAFRKQEAALKKAAETAASSSEDLQAAFAGKEIRALQNGISAALAKDYDERAPQQMVKDYDTFLSAYLEQAKKNDSKFDSQVLTAMQAYAGLVELNQGVINAARGVPIFTIEYALTRPAMQPTTHDVRFVYAQTLKAGPQFSANVAGSFYNSLPAGAKYGRVKDFQASAQADFPLGKKDSPTVVLSAAGYGQYQFDPTVLMIDASNIAPGTNITLPSNSQVLLGTSGWLGVVQGKATIKLPNSLSIPVAIKWSNKTDLIDATDVRGQVGISYDLSALSSLLKR